MKNDFHKEITQKRSEFTLKIWLATRNTIRGYESRSGNRKVKLLGDQVNSLACEVVGVYQLRPSYPFRNGNPWAVHVLLRAVSTCSTTISKYRRRNTGYGGWLQWGTCSDPPGRKLLGRSAMTDISVRPDRLIYGVRPVTLNLRGAFVGQTLERDFVRVHFAWSSATTVQELRFLFDCLLHTVRPLVVTYSDFITPPELFIRVDVYFWSWIF